MYDAYLFDMDGLLLDTERVGLSAFLTVLARYDVQAPDAEAFFISLIGGAQDKNRARVQAYLPGHIDIDGFGTDWHAQMDALMHEAVPLRPYVREVLETVATRARPMAVVTSTHGTRARAKLQKAGIIDYFDVVIAGDEVPASKPDPAPYIAAAQALNTHAPYCAAFEDSDTGIAAAVAAGCHAVQIPDLRAPDMPLPKLGQHVATDLRDALERIDAHAKMALG